MSEEELQEQIDEAQKEIDTLKEDLKYHEEEGQHSQTDATFRQMEATLLDKDPTDVMYVNMDLDVDVKDVIVPMDELYNWEESVEYEVTGKELTNEEIREKGKKLAKDYVQANQPVLPGQEEGQQGVMFPPEGPVTARDLNELSQQPQQAAPPAEISTAEINQIKNSAGGEKAYANIVNWAKTNLPENQIQAFDEVVNSGSVQAIQLAVSGLKAEYDNANGVEGRMVTGKAPKNTGDVFRSQAELVSAMSDRRYDSDPAYLSLIHISEPTRLQSSS